MRSDRPLHTAVTRPSRRGFLAGSSGLAGLLALGACSSDGGSSSGSGSSGRPGGGTTRTISTVKGTVTVPSDPKRVVCIDPGFSWETLVEVGMIPVGVPNIIPAIVTAPILAKVRGVPTVAAADGSPNLEKIAALKPDLILSTTGAMVDKVYPQLSAIAPTAVYTFALPSDWTNLAQSFANAVNRADALNSVKGQFTSRVVALKQKYGSVIAAQKWALVTESSKQVFVWGQSSSAGPVLTVAGAGFSAAAPSKSTPYAPLSLEKIPSLSDATAILYGATSTGAPFSDTGDLLEQELFTKLPAVRDGHLHALPNWFAYCYADALSQLDGIEKACAQLAH